DRDLNARLHVHRAVHGREAPFADLHAQAVAAGNDTSPAFRLIVGAGASQKRPLGLPILGLHTVSPPVPDSGGAGKAPSRNPPPGHQPGYDAELVDSDPP